VRTDQSREWAYGIRVAVNSRRRGADSENVERTDWFRVRTMSSKAATLPPTALQPPPEALPVAKGRKSYRYCHPNPVLREPIKTLNI
jgi:hypothetical protein